MARAGQLTREDWIDRARKALILSGVENVKVDVMARRLKVTRGSFYWHFKNRQELLDALIDDWEANNRRELSIMAARLAEGTAGLMEIFHIWLTEDPSFPSFDRAVRAWSLKSKRVAGAVGAIDGAWVTLFQTFFERSGIGEMESLVRARIIYFHQVGYYAVALKESVDQRMALLPYYFVALIGSPPPEGAVEALRSGMMPKHPQRKVGPEIGEEGKGGTVAMPLASQKIARKAARGSGSRARKKRAD
ncbi:MAG: TetR/AcrR family transcriptional regulator [Pseudomonadota bacterium]